MWLLWNVIVKLFEFTEQLFSRRGTFMVEFLLHNSSDNPFKKSSPYRINN